MRRYSLFALAFLALSCSRASRKPAEHTPPATVNGAVTEAELTTVTLTPEAEERLAVATAAVERRGVPTLRRLGGEVVAPAGRGITVHAPMTGTLLAPASGSTPAAGAALQKGQAVFRLRPLPAAADLAGADARLQAARAKLGRAEALLEAGATSARALEEARAEAEVAESSVRSLRPSADDGSGDVLVLAAPESGLLGAVRVAVGQPVAAGVALFDVVPRDRLWIKVAVYVGDLGSIDTAEPAGVRRYSAPPGTPPKAARPIDGPPSADPVAATSDLYYELTAPGWGLRPGQRVEVTLPLRETKSARVVPWEAVVFDIHGGAWVYERREPHVFVRRRVDVLRVDEALAVIARGPEEGTPVVTGGAAELFGAELGFGK